MAVLQPLVESKPFTQSFPDALQLRGRSTCMLELWQRFLARDASGRPESLRDAVRPPTARSPTRLERGPQLEQECVPRPTKSSQRWGS